jgi:glycosyltransferase involved in cell wall biosynthesis/thymidylate kinase
MENRAIETAPSRTHADVPAMIAFLKRNRYPLLAAKNDDDLRDYMQYPEFAAACEEEAGLLNSWREEYLIVRDRWAQAGIDCLLLKSGGLVPSFPYLSDNLDVLVKPENEEKARKILRELGYIELRNIEEPQKFLFRKFSGGRSVSAIHLHMQVGWLVGFMDEAALWKRMRVSPDDEKVNIPSPEDTILITAAHSFYENKRFRLADVARMRECWRQGGMDWGYMEGVARGRGWRDGLYFCLLTVAWLEKNLWGKTTIPHRLLKNWRASLKHWRTTYTCYRKLVKQGEISLPFNFSFLFSKGLYYKKIMLDKNDKIGEKLFNVARTLTIGLKLKSGIRPRPSLLVTFSGPDGSGKTQLAQALAQALTTSELKPKIYWSRCGTSGIAKMFSGIGKSLQRRAPAKTAGVPGAVGRGQRLRNPLFRFAWSYLSAADMIATYFTQVGLPRLFGRIIICDRYVYDAAAEMECSLQPKDRLNRLAIKLMLALAPKPDVAYLLDIPEKVCAARKNDNTAPGYLRRQRKAYFELAGRYELKIKDTNRELKLTVDEIVREVMPPYLDNFETALNGLFLANSSQLNPGRERPLKVLFLTNMYPTREMPSFGTFVQDQAEALRREGAEIDVLLVNGRKNRINYLWGIWRFWKQILTHDYDVIHAHYFYSGFIARLQNMLPIVLTHHGPEVFMTRERYPARAITPFMDKIILVSPEQKRRMGHQTAAVIPCGVDFETFRPVPRDEARQKLNLPEDKKFVLWAGEYFRPIKRWDIVQAAVAKARKTDPNIDLVLLSGKPHAEVPLYLSACDCLLLVSDGEGSPMVIKEAMACNLPIVAFPTGDVAEVVEGTEGCYLCSQDPADVAAKLCLALQTPRRSNGRERVAPMEQGNIARQIISVYRETIEGKPRRAKAPSKKTGVKRACIVRINYYPDEPHVRRDAETLVESGFGVDVISLRRKGQKAHEVIGGVNVYRLPMEHRRQGILRYIYEYTAFFVLAFGRLSLLQLRKRYQVVQVINLPDLLVFTAIIPKICGAKVALNFFELMPEVLADKLALDLEHPLVKVFYWLEKLCAGFADHVIAANGVSQEDRLAKNGVSTGKMSSVLNVPDDEFFYPRPPRPDKKAFRLITHGSILERYGIQYLIKAASRVARDVPGLEVKIVGEGEYRPQLEQLVKSLGLQRVVSFTGRLPFEEMLELLAKADVGIVSLLPQKQPQMPCKLFEYLAMSKPAVCAALPAVRPYFKDSAVMYYQPEDVAGLSRCLLELYHNPEKRAELAASGWQAYQRYGWANQKKEYLQVFAKLGKGKDLTPPAGQNTRS